MSQDLTPEQRLAIFRQSIQRMEQVTGFLDTIGAEVLDDIQNGILSEILKSDQLETDRREKLCMHLKWFAEFRLTLGEILRVGEQSLELMREEKQIINGERKPFF